MAKLTGKVAKATKSAQIFGTAGALIGGAATGAVCAVGGSFFGPVGTFFGLACASGAGNAVGGGLGTAVGFAYSMAREEAEAVEG